MTELTKHILLFLGDPVSIIPQRPRKYGLLRFFSTLLSSRHLSGIGKQGSWFQQKISSSRPLQGKKY